MDHERVSHYEIGRSLGRGGMGEVFEAYDVRTRRQVALKFVAAERAADPLTVRRFESEAVHAAQMQHPHIATVYEFDPDAERPFIAMELVKGPTLRARIDQGPLPVMDVLTIARDVASALAYAHRRDVIHRDIKPENLMFDDEGRIKVMDFGLARGINATRLTSSWGTVGTVAYMAPETIRGAGGPPADVFALGLVLVEMATGRRVFDQDTAMALLYAISNEGAPPVRARWPEAPDDVAALGDRMLATNVADRVDAATAARELARITGASPAEIESSSRPKRGLRLGPIPPTRALLIGLTVVVAAAGVIQWRGMARTRVSPERRQRAVSLNNQAFQQLQRGDLGSARALAVASLGMDPRYAEAQLNVARIQTLEGQIDSATAAFERLSKAQDERVRYMAIYGLGDINLQSGSPEQAVRRFRECLAIDSTGKEAINGLGLALVRAGRSREGLELLRRGLERFPSEPALYKNAALASWKLQDASSALRYSTQALQLEPGYGEALGLRSRARARLGDHTGAVDDWNRYVASEPAPADSEEVLRDLVAAGIPLAALGAPAP
jgi:tetratricopeptide (TPR) repeat protein